MVLKEETYDSSFLFSWQQMCVNPLYTVTNIYSIPSLDFIGKRPVKSEAAQSCREMEVRIASSKERGGGFGLGAEDGSKG